MKLSEKAEEPPDVTAQVDELMETYYQFVDEDPELVDCDEITPEDDFPIYGDFLEVRKKSPVDGTFRGEGWILVTTKLAKWLVENDVTSSDWWVVKDVEKIDGEWTYDCEIVDDA